MSVELKIATAETVSGAANSSTKQSLDKATDVSGFETIDLQFCLIAADNANGASITMLASMQNTSDDASWVSVGTTGNMSTSSGPVWVSLTIPATGTNPLFKYLRYQVTRNTGTTSTTFSITGLARRTSF